MKLKEIILNYQTLVKQIEYTYPVKLGYAIARNFESLQKEVSVYDKERQKLIAEYAKKDDEGKPVIKNNEYQFDNDVKETFIAELDELQDSDVKIDLVKVSVDQIEKCDTQEKYHVPTNAEMTGLLFMIE